MNKTVLSFVNKLEGYKTAIKQLHWDAKNLSQHELCDDIADSIAEFQDTVSEVEQSITGKLKVNSLQPTEYKIKDLKSFVQDVLDETNTFYKEVKGMGDTYVGMASDCESFLSDMQRKLYLVNFTLKEELKARLKAKLNESMPKNLANHDEVDKFIGRRPKTMKARINQIYRIVKKYGIDSKLYHDDHWQAKDDYYRAITSLGCEFEMRPCGNSNNLNNWDDITSDGGYTDYAEDGMPRSKQYAVKIMYDDGMNIGGYIKFMAAGRVDDPFSAYDTCMILWPKSNKVLETKNMNRQMRLTEAELKQVIKEAAIKLIKEKIEIDPKNKGKFTATKKATGKSTEELTNSKNPLTRKRANFAKMAKRHWKPLKESDYMDDGNLELQYRKNPDSMWTYGTNLNPSGVDGLEPNQVRDAGNGNIKDDNNASWDYFDAVSNGADMKMRNRLDADYRERTNNSPFNGIRKRMDMAMAFPRQTPNERFKQDLDKQWKDTQDVEKYSMQADSRPLHRKGSLNRA